VIHPDPAEAPLEDFTDRRLTVTVDKDISMNQVFDSAYQGLCPRAARAYRLLGLLPGDHFDTALAGAVLGVPTATVVDVLEDLVDASLLHSDDVDRYYFHDLVRDHARHCAEREDDAEERESILISALDRYLYRAAQVYRTVMPLEWRAGLIYERLQNVPLSDSGSAAALDSLEPELPNLMAVIQAGVRDHQDELVWQLCEALWPLFLYRKHFADWIQAYQWGIEAATRCTDHVALSRMHHHLGLAYHNQRRPGDAAEHGMLALRAARESGHRPAESSALSLIGMADRIGGRVHDAITIFREVVEFDRREGLRRSEALNHRRLGQALIDAGHLDEAIIELCAGRDQAAALPDPIAAAMTTVWLAEALGRVGQSSDAERLLQEVGPIVSGEGSPQYAGLLHLVWGEIAQRDGDHDTARGHLAQARDLFIAIGAPHVERVQAALDRLDSTPGSH